MILLRFQATAAILADLCALEGTETAADEAARALDIEDLLRAFAAMWTSFIVLSNFFNVDKVTVLNREYSGPVFKSSAIRSMDLPKEGAKREMLVCNGCISPIARNAAMP
ncbi:hypothetical protein [Mesorhizobium mediterraneum]|uniref:hypothetical protein n=1 Tax=Mesorhizobium mediterraneum TaxID=43617 RepID=UPI001786404D|nr:hypothetical protein [Mesorhizobium mediterraneum]